MVHFGSGDFFYHPLRSKAQSSQRSFTFFIAGRYNEFFFSVFSVTSSEAGGKIILLFQPAPSFQQTLLRDVQIPAG